MLIAAGSGHSFWLSKIKALKNAGYVDLVYPEFFDDKKTLVRGRHDKYLAKLHAKRGLVKVAVWPDYYYSIWPKSTFNVEWVFPLHSKDEIDFLLKLEPDYVGFPNDTLLRDYSLSWYVRVTSEYGLSRWLLGFKQRYLKYVHVFDATDITSLGLGFRYVDIKQIPLKEIADAIKKIEDRNNNLSRCKLICVRC